MSASSHRLPNSQNLAQIVPENKGVLPQNLDESGTSMYIFYAGLAAVILISLVLVLVIKRHKRHHRSHS